MIYIILKSLYRYTYSYFNINKLLTFGFSRVLNTLNFKTHKKSDTLFVLGSGSSINAISEKGWDVIKDADSIGLNFWPIHDFVPSYLMFEMPRGERARYFYQTLALKKEEYDNVPLIFKGLYKNRGDFGDIKKVSSLFPKELLSNIYLGREISIPGRSEEEFSKALIQLRKLGFFEPSDNFNALAQYRGTVTCAIIFGIKAGYKKIVLCGVDLNDTKYFYDELREYYQLKGIEVPESGQVGIIHKTNVPLEKVLSISKAISLLNDFFKTNFNGKLYISSQNSALSPLLDYFDLAEK